jgi:REP element-mobilizing transposase RayT
MPKKNIVKIYGADQYYHIYNRGGNKNDIFREPSDYFYFLSLFKRYLSNESDLDSRGRSVSKYNDEVDLVAYCLMPNHFHLLCYLKEQQGIVHLMRSVMTSYTMYFNKKYKRSGKLYEGVFLASRIDNDIYLWQVSRYIHLNPIDIGADFRTYDYSSIDYFVGSKRADWLHPEKLVETSADKREYLEFVSDYETMHQDLKFLKNVLASSD